MADPQHQQSPDLEEVMSKAERAKRRSQEAKDEAVRDFNRRAWQAHQAAAELSARVVNETVEHVPTVLDGILDWMRKYRQPLLIGAGSYGALIALELAVHKARQVYRGRSYYFKQGERT